MHGKKVMQPIIVYHPPIYKKFCEMGNIGIAEKPGIALRST